MVWSAAWNPAGGVRYHARAWRRRDRAWLAYRNQLAEWLTRWHPAARTLAIVGPSGGYCLPLEVVRRFSRLVVFEPDPIARFIFNRRLLRELAEPPAITWITQDAWVQPLLTGGGVPDALLRQDTAILFSNVVGQFRYLVRDDDWERWRDAWCARVWPILSRTAWASFHDRVSGTTAPRLPATARTRRLTDAELNDLYEPDVSGSPLELLDHRSQELLPEGESYRYFDWPLTEDTHHLIEGVIGKPYLPSES